MGYCFSCARKIGLPNLEGMIKQLGIDPDMIEDMEDQMMEAARAGDTPLGSIFGGEDEDYDEYDDDDDEYDREDDEAAGENEDEPGDDEPDDENGGEEDGQRPVSSSLDMLNKSINDLFSMAEDGDSGETKPRADLSERTDGADDDDQVAENDNDRREGFSGFFNPFGNSFEMGGAQFADGKREKRKKRGKSDKKRPFLSQYCENLTKRAKEGGIEDIIGRDREINRVIQILCRKSKNNPMFTPETAS